MCYRRLKKSFALLLLMALMISALQLHGTWLHSSSSFKPVGYEPYLQDILKSATQEMQEKLGLVATQAGSVSDKTVKEVEFSFIAYRRASMEEARALFVGVAERLAELVNQHEKIQPYLEVRPFTADRVSMRISFAGPYGDYSDGTVTFMYNSLTRDAKCSNWIFYRATDPFTDNLMVLWDESYPEAVEKVRLDGVPSLTVHTPRPHEAPFDEALLSLAREMKQSYGIESWSLGGQEQNGIDEIGGLFVLVRRTPLGEARKAITTVAESLLRILNDSKSLQPFFKEVPFPVERLRLQLKFVDSNYFKYGDETIEKVLLEKGRLSYIRDNLKEYLERPEEIVRDTFLEKEESYAEALQQVR